MKGGGSEEGEGKEKLIEKDKDKDVTKKEEEKEDKEEFKEAAEEETDDSKGGDEESGSQSSEEEEDDEEEEEDEEGEVADRSLGKSGFQQQQRAPMDQEKVSKFSNRGLALEKDLSWIWRVGGNGPWRRRHRQKKGRKKSSE